MPLKFQVISDLHLEFHPCCEVCRYLNWAIPKGY